MSKPSLARYLTTNWSSYSASLRKGGSLLIWLDKNMTWLAPHDRSPGRHAVFSDVAVQFGLTIKVPFKLPLRQTTGIVASLLKMADLDWAVPDYTTLCRRQRSLAVQIPCRRADGPLNLLVDSTGIKFLGDGEWQARKHGVRGRRQSLPGRGLRSNRPRGGARCISRWIRPLWISGRSSLPLAAMATAPCCQSCSIRSPQVKRSAP
jgi:hypothetical protein